MSATVPAVVERLIEAFSRLPGIGPKTASRLTFHLLRTSDAEAQELAQALKAMAEGTRLCSVCFNITGVDLDPCGLCRDTTRDNGVVCVVEEPLDVLAIDRTGLFRGRYHVLHGAISPVEGIGPEDLKIEALIERVDRGGVRELILATNPTMEGEATAMYLKRRLDGRGLKMTRLARGLPAGGDLEYADSGTLSQALEGRQEM
jgi:recombination protein RecR